ncbi:MAG: hypothetical protein AABW73_02455 [Nanoarchaeota archaeon]
MTDKLEIRVTSDKEVRCSDDEVITRIPATQNGPKGGLFYLAYVSSDLARNRELYDRAIHDVRTIMPELLAADGNSVLSQIKLTYRKN